jgi:uncharacterized membrane protein (DUF485 family)
MPDNDKAWAAIGARPEFHALTKRRRAVTLRLFAVSMALFFSIPLISQLWPEMFRVRVSGAVNLGLIYLIGQYVAGVVIACLYVMQLRAIDEMATHLRAAGSQLHPAMPRPPQPVPSVATRRNHAEQPIVS